MTSKLAMSREALLNEAYRGILDALLGQQSLREFADLVVGYARIVLDAEGASIAEIEGDCYHFLALAGGPIPEKGIRVPLAGGFTGSVVKTRQARYFDLAGAPPESRARAEKAGIVSGIVVPIIVDGEIYGTVGVTSSQASAFDSHDLDVLVGFAEYFAVALTLRRRLVTTGPA